MHIVEASHKSEFVENHCSTVETVLLLLNHLNGDSTKEADFTVPRLLFTNPPPIDLDVHFEPSIPTIVCVKFMRDTRKRHACFHDIQRI
jgi:hypothetical protein